MLRRVLLRFFWDSYDGVLPLTLANVLLAIPGGVLVYGFLAALQVFEGAVHPSLLTAAVWGVLLVPGYLSVSAALLLPAVRRIATDETAYSRRLIAQDFRRVPRLFVYHLAVCIIAFALVATAWFYLFSGQVPAATAHIGRIIGGLCLWAMILPLGMMLHGAPLIIFNEVRPGRALVLSLSMVFAFPGLTLSALMVLALLTMLGAGFAFTGLILFGAAGTASLCHALFTVIAGRVEAVTQSTPQDDDREEPRYERTLRDVLRPWS